MKAPIPWRRLRPSRVATAALTALGLLAALTATYLVGYDRGARARFVADRRCRADERSCLWSLAEATRRPAPPRHLLDLGLPPTPAIAPCPTAPRPWRRPPAARPLPNRPLEVPPMSFLSDPNPEPFYMVMVMSLRGEVNALARTHGSEEDARQAMRKACTHANLPTADRAEARALLAARHDSGEGRERNSGLLPGLVVRLPLDPDASAQAHLVAKTTMRLHTLDAMTARIPRCAGLVARPAASRPEQAHSAAPSAREPAGALSDSPHQWVRRPTPRAVDRLPARPFLQRGPSPRAERQNAPGARDAR